MSIKNEGINREEFFFEHMQKQGGFVMVRYSAIPLQDYDAVQEHVEDVATRLGVPVNLAIYPRDITKKHYDIMFYPSNISDAPEGIAGWHGGVKAYADRIELLSARELKRRIGNSGASVLDGPEYLFITPHDAIPSTLSNQTLEKLHEKGLPELTLFVLPAGIHGGDAPGLEGP